METSMLHAPTSETRNDVTQEKRSPIRLSQPVHAHFAQTGEHRHLSHHTSVPAANWPRQRYEAFARAQSTYGNQAVLRMLKHSTNSSGPMLQRKCACGGSGGDCAECN